MPTPPTPTPTPALAPPAPPAATSPAAAPLLEAFLGALDEAARPAFQSAEARAATAASLVAAVGAAHAAYPATEIPDTRFAAELGRRLGEAATPAQLAATRADHVYLSIACAAGDPAAIARFEADFLVEVDACGRRLRATPDQAAEVRGHLRRVLFVSEPGRPAATGEFSGKGDLRSYIRVMATRELIRMVNKGRREVGIPDEAVLDLLSPATDPALGYLRDQYRADVDAAIRVALGRLADQPRALLRYHLIDGWSIDRVGALYGVHRATAARWLAAARDGLAIEIRRELAARLAIAVDEVDSIVRLVQSRIDVSLERMLDPPSDP
jgi:RNA polymerase sigma-70 factor, ECF subfamily